MTHAFTSSPKVSATLTVIQLLTKLISRHSFATRALKNAMRAVDLKPGDGERAIEEMRAAGADIIDS